MFRRWCWLLVLFAIPAAAQQPNAPQKDQPVGLVLAAAGGMVRRAGNELAIAVRPGDLMFSGDVLEASQGSVTFLFCPEKISATLPRGGRILFEASRLQVQQGAPENRQTANFCILPPVEKAPPATRFHYGETRTRALAPGASPPNATSFETRLRALPVAQRDALLAELAPIDRALSTLQPDPAARLARAVVLAKYGLPVDAGIEYGKLSETWNSADWTRLLVHETAAEPVVVPSERPGETYALVVGISRYQRLTEDEQLRFAHADAETFANFLKSPRGGVPERHITLLSNEQATTAAIRTSVESFLKARAGRNDTLVLFIAAHGTVANTPNGPAAFIITYDSDPQDLATTALPMADIQSLMAEQMTKVGRVIIYVDVCRAGIIGTIKNNTVNGSVQELFDQEGDLFGFLASRPRELSIESERFGGGHGAFSYFLLRALNGDADTYDAGNHDGVVSVNEVVDYVRDLVRDATRNKQHPVERVEVSGDPELSAVEKEGILIAGWIPAQGTEIAMRSVAAPQQTSATASSNPSTTDIEEQFQRAIAENRILPDTVGSAFQYLEDLRQQMPEEEYLVAENDLRIALEDQGQQVLLRYLTGDQVPQSRSDFERGARHFEAAQRLVSGSLFLEGREAFSRGRLLVFDKKYPEAVQQLERAVRLDPNGAYSYNALGIAYLEQSDYTRAVQAFRDASRRAPYWAYPLHNLALAYTEMGDYQAAIRTYETAMTLAPDYSYLPYNLGVLFQRLNRRRAAERALRRAAALSPELAEPLSALGVLYASTGRTRDAERYYREALAKDATLEAARYNLALLLSSQQEQIPEAVALLRDNIAQSDDSLTSRVLLAELLARQGDVSGAIGEYQAVIATRPEYVAARIALTGLLSRSGRLEEAMEQLQAVVQQDSGHGGAYELMGDIEKSRGRIAEAQAAYERVLGLEPDSRTRKAVQAKIKNLLR